MTITLQEINERKQHLRQEILERECLLAALEVLHKHITATGGSKRIDLSALFPAWLPTPGTPAHVPQVSLVDPAPQALPPQPPPEPYIHPDLKKLGTYHGANTRYVQWAIGQLTGDYTLQDIRALLEREGRPLEAPEISVVLSRLKKRHQVIEVRRGNGRTPAIFRQASASGADPLPATA